eukprot:TRINITY_DN7977_c0_g2_i2.p1 TRINITY_DN7977_c0_g2~~TRINITY_DN7977_c0_g2_i2.p1  ORF type:complete len:550 (-),score=47.03 TRINITY_DN7977_c0_g2_i2:138-1787(-)
MRRLDACCHVQLRRRTVLWHSWLSSIWCCYARSRNCIGSLRRNLRYFLWHTVLRSSVDECNPRRGFLGRCEVDADPPGYSAGEATTRGSAYAVKMWNESHEDQDMKVFHEVRHLVKVQGHPNIGEFVGFFRSSVLTDRPRWLMVMEAYGAGDLQAAIAQRGAYPQQDALTLVTGVLRALAHIHALEIVHRDVKLENLLLKDDGDIVLVDFGLAVHMSETRERMRVCGTPGSIAPETLLGLGSEKKSDIFGCGAVLYGLLGGVLPFVRDDHDSTIRANRKANVRFPETNFGHVSEEVRQLVRNMLHRLPPRRLDSYEALGVLGKENEGFSVAIPGGGTQIESTSAVVDAPSTSQTRAALPGVAHEMSVFAIEAEKYEANVCDTDAVTMASPSSFCHLTRTFDSYDCDADVSSTMEMPSSTWSARGERDDGIERRSTSKSSKFASRLVSTSIRPFVWIRRRMTHKHGRISCAYDDKEVPVKGDSFAGTGSPADDVSDGGSLGDTGQPTQARQRGIWQSLRGLSVKRHAFRTNSSCKSFSSLVCNEAQSPTG